MSDWNKYEPWFEIKGFAQIILDKISILDILNKYGIDYVPTYAGSFTHKSHCPFPAHLDGNERTASFFISEEENDFYCFGCNAKGNVIDFVRLYKGMPYYRALEELSNIAGITSGDLADIKPREKRDPRHRILPHIHNAGVAIREHVKNINDPAGKNKWSNWANRQFVKMDKMLNDFTDDDWEKAERFSNAIVRYLKDKA